MQWAKGSACFKDKVTLSSWVKHYVVATRPGHSFAHQSTYLAAGIMAMYEVAKIEVWEVVAYRSIRAKMTNGQRMLTACDTGLEELHTMERILRGWKR